MLRFSVHELKMISLAVNLRGMDYLDKALKDESPDMQEMDLAVSVTYNNIADKIEEHLRRKDK